MTKVLVIGASGMLGHKVLQRLAPRFETVGTVRTAVAALDALMGSRSRIIEGIDVDDEAVVRRTIREERPDVIVNCAGIIKQRPEGSDEIRAMNINARFPHRLTTFAAAANARVIHLSTDCVFSGTRGGYAEEDVPDPVDLYGESKLQGEVVADNAITLRTSMIGRELREFRSLLEWFLRRPAGTIVRGYTRAIFSGLTNITVADEIARLIAEYPNLHGVYHLSAEAISKYDLLLLAREAFGTNVEVTPDDSFQCDRSLVSNHYREATGFTPRSWKQMVCDLAADPTPYSRLTA